MRVTEYVERIQEAGRRAGFSLGYFGEVDGVGLPVLERHVENAHGHAYISAGIHGNEPAACLALLYMLRMNVFPQTLSYTIIPMLNPSGLLNNERENGHGIDLNRDYGPAPVSEETRLHMEWMRGRSFDLAICLHEDDDGEGYYLYAHFADKSMEGLEAVALSHAVQVMPIDSREIIDEMPAASGKVLPPEDLLQEWRSDMPEALYLLFNHNVRAVLTTETPSGLPVGDRVDAHHRATIAVLELFAEKLSQQQSEA
jgi:hypothetical protein